MNYSRDLLTVGSIWKHVKKGSTYRIVGIIPCATNDRDGELSVIYRGDTGTWYREINEFLDGRFEPIDPNKR